MIRARHEHKLLVLAILGLAVIFTAQSVRAEPVAYWTFDETSGTIAQDSVNDYDATLHGAGFAPGRRGNALWLDESTDYADVAGLTNTYFENYTIELCFMRTDEYEDACLYMKGDASGAGQNRNFAAWHYGQETSATEGQFWVEHEDKNDVARGFYSNGTFGVGTWHHVAQTYDGSTLKLYIDGKLDNSMSSVPPPGEAGPFALVIGNNGNHNGALIGYIDDLRLFSHARTGDEIAADAAACVPEPFSMAFMGSAFVGVVAYRVRKRGREAKLRRE